MADARRPIYQPYQPFQFEVINRRPAMYIPTSTTEETISIDTVDEFVKPSKIYKNKSKPARVTRKSEKKDKTVAEEMDMNDYVQFKSKNKKPEKQNDLPLKNVEMKNLDEMLNTQSIVDYLELN